MHCCSSVGLDPKEPPAANGEPPARSGRLPVAIAPEKPCIARRSQEALPLMMYTSQVQLQVFLSKTRFFFLFRPGLLCFFSTRSVVFIGGAADDAATLENCWCDFYRRTGNMGHKTRLHFPQADKKHSPPPPSLSKHRTSAGSLSH